MKKHLLLYGMFIALLVTGCKKSNFEKPGTIPNNGKLTGKGSNPSSNLPSSPLTNFKINGANCAFDSTGMLYYYPVSAVSGLTNYTVSFDTTITKALYIDNVRIKSGATVNATLAVNQQIILKPVDVTNTGPTYKLILTGLPLVMLTANAAIADDKVSATFDMVDPDYLTHGSQLEVASNIEIAIRGGTSRAYPKKSYAVSMVDAGGADADVSLLGLRNDNNWILDAMYIDQARMRNRVCTDIWNSFNNVPYIATETKALNGTRGYMAEVFLNSRYLGVYCLTEKLDRKQLQIKKQYGNMYKADFWTDGTDFMSVIPYDNTSKTWSGWELEYPDLGDTPAPNWGYLSDEVSFIATSSDQDFTNNITNKVDIANMVDYFIFLNITQAFDNENKNTFFSFYDSRNSSNFFYSPWDLDGTLGRNVAGTVSANDIIGASNNNLLQRLLNLNPGNFKALLKARWNALKNNQLSKTTVNNRLEGYRKILVNTNAFARERAKWTNITQDLDSETNYISNWYNSQYDLFDNYVNGL